MNRSLCCFFSCKNCFQYFFSCCDSNKLFENIIDEARKVEEINKKEVICIMYRLTGIWNWFAKILTNFHIYYCAIVLYLNLIVNMGFENKFSDNIQKNIGGCKNIYLINGITLIYILLMYLINMIIGKYTIISLKKRKRNENN